MRNMGGSAPDTTGELELNTDEKVNAARDNCLLQYLIFQPHALLLEPLTKMHPLRRDVSNREKLSREQTLGPPV